VRRVEGEKKRLMGEKKRWKVSFRKERINEREKREEGDRFYRVSTFFLQHKKDEYESLFKKERRKGYSRGKGGT